jgi:hypothetical protein
MKIPLNPEVVSLPLSWLYRLWTATIRVHAENMEPLQDIWEREGSIVLACWHNELFIFPKLRARTRSRWVGIVSLSKDGTIATRMLNHLGVDICQGSSSRGGVRALMGACRMVRKQGRQGFITVDGPRGPRHEVKDGVFYLAQKARSPIVPARVVPSRAKVFDRSWDKFILPLPFSSCRIIFGEPYHVSEAKLTDEVLAEERRKLKEKLDALV